MSKEVDKAEMAYIPQIQSNVDESYCQANRISRAIDKLTEAISSTTNEEKGDTNKEMQLSIMERLQSDTKTLYGYIDTLADRLETQLHKLLGA